MTKQEFINEYMGETKAIHLPTLKLYNEFMELANSFDIRVASITRDNAYNTYVENTCVQFESGSTGVTYYCSKDFYESRGYDVVEFKSQINLYTVMDALTLIRKDNSRIFEMPNAVIMKFVKAIPVSEGSTETIICKCDSITDKCGVPLQIRGDDNEGIMLKEVFIPKLSERAKTLLSLLDSEYKYLTKDDNGAIDIHVELPTHSTHGEWWTYCKGSVSLYPFSSHFTQLKPDKHYVISELINS